MSEPTAAKGFKGNNDATVVEPFSSLQDQGGFPMAHTMRTESPHLPRDKYEMILMGLSGAICNKPEWFRKVNNPNITTKWKDEACEPGAFPQLDSLFKDIVDGEDPLYGEDEALMRSVIGDSHCGEDDTINDEMDEDWEAADFEPMSPDEIMKLKEEAKMKLEDLADLTPPETREPNLTTAEEGPDDVEDDEEEEEEDGEKEDLRAYLDTIWDTNKDTMYKPRQRKVMSSFFAYALKECQWMAGLFEATPSSQASLRPV